MYELTTDTEMPVALKRASFAAKARASKASVATTDKTIQKALERLDPARRSVLEKKLEEMPKTVRRNYIRAAMGRIPPRGAIKSHCLECVGWSRAEVANCTSLACPLYAYRPSFKDRG